MGKYPVLNAIAAIARFVGWLGLIIGGFMFVLGAADFFANVRTGPGSYGGGPFRGYFGMMELVGGLSLAMGALMVIALGETIRVFVDIEANTSEATRLLREKSEISRGQPGDLRGDTAREPHSRPQAQSIERVSLPWKLNDEDEEAAQIIIHMTKQQGWIVNKPQEHMFVFAKGDSVSICYSLLDLRKFDKQYNITSGLA